MSRSGVPSRQSSPTTESRLSSTRSSLTTLIAMVVYALFFWIVVRVIPIVMDRPSARTVSRSVREQTPGGVAGTSTERTTHTINS